MAYYDDFSLRVTNLKCFGDEPQGFDTFRAINLIVGRNNSGKSTLLDLVEYATRKVIDIPFEQHRETAPPPAVYSRTKLSQEDINFTFPRNTQSGAIVGNHHDFGLQLLGAEIDAVLSKPANERFVSISKLTAPPLDTLKDYSAALASRPSRNPFSEKNFFRITPERVVVPEPDNQQINLAGNGVGITNAIQVFLNHADRDRSVIRESLMHALNEVFLPDGEFTDIVCRVHGGRWEVQLEERRKGLVRLSQSGSGLKTVILALCFVHLLPKFSHALCNWILAFEEPENNLHPALQRRLLAYLAATAKREGFPMFVTTHSSVAIDMFSRDSDAQIIHVSHIGVQSRARTATTYVEYCGLLDDLDVRASDLLQSNGIVWVEGPSDRIYLNRWIDLWSNGTLKEGVHYQCVFYAGRLLAHLSGEAPGTEPSKYVPMLQVNRNAAVVIDSDLRAPGRSINETKRRLAKEISDIGGLVWITDGREIENYVHPDIIAAWKGPIEKEAAVDPYETLFDFLDRHYPTQRLGTEMFNKKPLLAEYVAAHTNTRETLARSPGLGPRLEALCAQISRWNNLPAT